MSQSEGQRVDQFYTHQPRPASLDMLSILKKGFDYLECQSCGRIVETARLEAKALQEWKFDLMGLRPSILAVAKGVCPVCQEMRKQFKGILEA